jgi:DNA-binding transcriptional regulator LsrR (DeoR family)
MKPSPDPTTIYRIARYYYEEGLSQEEVARREGFSRSQISRLLDKAKEMGMVRIQLIPPTELVSEGYAAMIARELDLKGVLVVPGGTVKATDGMAMAKIIATAAVDIVQAAILSHRVIGMGWGRTVYELSQLIPYQESSMESRFVPLVGTSGNDNPNLQINTIIDRLSCKFHSKGLFVNAQAVREKGATLTRIEREREANLLKQWDSVEIAVVGLGEPPRFATDFLVELPDSSRDDLCSSDAVGDLLGRYFRADGCEVGIGESYEQLAFPLGRFSSLERVFCLAGGAEKVVGIEAAARAKYITDLVTDEATARALCERLKKGDH